MLKVNNEGTTSRPVILIPLPLSAFLIFSLLKKKLFPGFEHDPSQHLLDTYGLDTRTWKLALQRHLWKH